MSTPAQPIQGQQTLAGMIRGKYPGTYDDLDDATLEKNVLAKYPQYSDLPRSGTNSVNQTLSQTTGISAPPKAFTLPWLKQGLWRAAASTADAMPAIGGTIGSMIGATAGSGAPGPGTAAGAIGGAGMGGLGGTAAQQIMRRILGYPDVPQTSGQAAQDITKGGVTQAGIQGVTEGLPFLAGPLKNAATTQYEKALAPTTKINKSITQDIVPELINRGEYGSLGSLEQRAGQRAAEIRPQLDAQYGQLQQTIPQIPDAGTKVINDLEAAKSEYMAGGQVANPAGVKAISDVQDIVRQYGPDVSPTTLRELRQVFENPVAKAGGFAGQDLSTKYALNAQDVASNSIRRILNSSPSDIGALNKEISFWLDVQRVTRDSALRQTGQAGGLMKVLSPMAGSVAGAAGFAAGGTKEGIEAGLGTALTTAAFQIIRSPAWRTASAVLKDRLAGALARGDVGAVSALATRFGVAGLQSPQTPPAANPQTQQ